MESSPCVGKAESHWFTNQPFCSFCVSSSDENCCHELTLEMKQGDKGVTPAVHG